jgi:hypothetical protein
LSTTKTSGVIVVGYAKPLRGFLLALPFLQGLILLSVRS